MYWCLCCYSCYANNEGEGSTCAPSYPPHVLVARTKDFIIFRPNDDEEKKDRQKRVRCEEKEEKIKNNEPASDWHDSEIEWIQAEKRRNEMYALQKYLSY